MKHVSAGPCWILFYFRLLCLKIQPHHNLELPCDIEVSMKAISMTTTPGSQNATWQRIQWVECTPYTNHSSKSPQAHGIDLPLILEIVFQSTVKRGLRESVLYQIPYCLATWSVWRSSLFKEWNYGTRFSWGKSACPEDSSLTINVGICTIKKNGRQPQPYGTFQQARQPDSSQEMSQCWQHRGGTTIRIINRETGEETGIFQTDPWLLTCLWRHCGFAIVFLFHVSRHI